MLEDRPSARAIPSPVPASFARSKTVRRRTLSPLPRRHPSHARRRSVGARYPLSRARGAGEGRRVPERGRGDAESLALTLSRARGAGKARQVRERGRGHAAALTLLLSRASILRTLEDRPSARAIPSPALTAASRLKTDPCAGEGRVRAPAHVSHRAILRTHLTGTVEGEAGGEGVRPRRGLAGQSSDAAVRAGDRGVVGARRWRASPSP